MFIFEIMVILLGNLNYVVYKIVFIVELFLFNLGFVVFFVVIVLVG